MRSLLLLLFATAVSAQQPTSVLPIAPLQEQRYCGPPKRNAAGEIIRRADVLKAFRQVHVCPATGITRHACPGWAIDHVVPLACGGCDAVSNLQWLPYELKIHGKDRFEREIYCISEIP